VSFALASVDIDTGRLVSSCDTGILVPPNQVFEDVGLAWDARGASLLVAACTDSVCAGYVQVSRLLPGSCKLTPVVKVPTDPSQNPQMGAAAFDAASGTFVMSLTQTIGGVTGLVLVAVDVAAGTVTHVLNEAARNIDVVSLTAEPGAPPGTFIGAVNLVGGSEYGAALCRYSAATNKFTRAPTLAGYGSALLSSALDAANEVLNII